MWDIKLLQTMTDLVFFILKFINAYQKLSWKMKGKIQLENNACKICKLVSCSKQAKLNLSTLQNMLNCWYWSCFWIWIILLLLTCFTTLNDDLDSCNLCQNLVLTTLYHWNIHCTTYWTKRLGSMCFLHRNIEGENKNCRLANGIDITVSSWPHITSTISTKM